MRWLLFVALLVAAVPAPAADPAWVEDARRVATSVAPKLLAVLKEEVDRGGAESAIAVCRDKAPALAKAASEQSGWSV